MAQGPLILKGGPTTGGQRMMGRGVWKHLRTLILGVDPCFRNHQILCNSWLGAPTAPLRSQNKRQVSWATKETSPGTGYIVLKCFEILSMVSKETQADLRGLLGKFRERPRGQVCVQVFKGL